MTRKVLLVDDDVNLLRGCERNLRGRVELETASGGEEGLRALESAGPFAVVVTDMRMPKMDGIRFLDHVSRRSPMSVRMMLTGNSDLETAIAAVNKGNVFRFIAKPCQAADLLIFLEAGLEQYALVAAERELLEGTLQGAVRMCTEILSLADARTYGTALRVRDLVRQVIPALKIDAPWQIEVAALLTRMGSAAIPPIVLTRHRHGASLAGAEKDMLARVPIIGHDLIRNIPRLDPVARIVLHSQKHFDGGGIPNDSVSGGDIPVGARLIRILTDFVELLDSGASKAAAVEKLASRVGWYDPDMLSTVAPVLCPPPSGGTETEASLEVAFQELRTGDLLQSNVETVEGVLVMQAGTLLTSTLLERLRNFAALQVVREPIRVERMGKVPSAV